MRRRNFTIQVSPLSPIPRTWLPPPSVPPSPPLVQLLVNSFPFVLEPVRELGDQKAQRGAGLPETGGGGVTPLMVRSRAHAAAS